VVVLLLRALFPRFCEIVPRQRNPEKGLIKRSAG
jgi:hypothetical protein